MNFTFFFVVVAILEHVLPILKWGKWAIKADFFFIFLLLLVMLMAVHSIVLDCKTKTEMQAFISLK